MVNVRANLSENLVFLRQKSGITQAELAEKLHYSDKAVSKWERGESVPDVQVLVQISELFGVSLDDLVRKSASEGIISASEGLPEDMDRTPAGLPQDAEKSENTSASGRKTDEKHKNHALITAMSVVLVWLIATMAFATLQWLPNVNTLNSLAFLCAAPVSLVVWLVFNTIWFDRRRNFLIISLLLWVTLAAVFLSMLYFEHDLWLLFVIGAPAQIIILLWSGITRKKLAPNAVEIR